jgi:uncharacterized protein (TIGR00290 family)
MALQVARDDDVIDVTGLLSTVNAAADRVAMHAVRRVLLDAQAERLGLPLHVAEIPSPCPNDVYEAQMASALERATGSGARHLVFGDLFLEDVRAYREKALRATGIAPMFPLWGRPTAELARQILDAGIRAVVTCVDPRQMPPDMVGRAYDARFLADLPAGVDPCGERGEFHTFVWDSPAFSAPIDVEVGEVVERDGFVFCDVLPV